MLTLETQYRFRDMLQTVAYLETNIERQRQRISNMKEFNPYAAFCRINRPGDKKITSVDIERFLT